MQFEDGVAVGDAGDDQLSAAGVAGHEVRLYQAYDDAQVRLYEAPVNQDGDARRRSAEIGMRCAVPGEVVGNVHFF